MCTMVKEAPHQQWEAFVLGHIDVAYDVAYQFAKDSSGAQALVEKTLEFIWANPDELIHARHPKARLLAILRSVFMEEQQANGLGRHAFQVHCGA